MEVLPYLFIAVLGVLSGVLSGIGGGGGGMLMIPAFILVGLPPQNAVATGKMNGLGAALGGLSAFSKSGHIRKDILKVMIPIALIVGVTTPFVFSAIESTHFQIALGCVLVLLSPLLFLKKKNSNTKEPRKKLGYLAYTGVLTIQALFGSGVGMLALYVQKFLLGTSNIEANATKRAVTSVLTPITFVALLIGGYVSLSYGIVGFITVLIGTNLGSHIALRKGDQFVAIFMSVASLLSGMALIVAAL